MLNKKMTLPKISDVVIDFDTKEQYKYIVANISDGKETKTIIRGGEKYYLHLEILSDLYKEAEDLEVKCLGGGHIKINSEAKIIELSDESSKFGKEPDRQKTADIIKINYPEFEVRWG